MEDSHGVIMEKLINLQMLGVGTNKRLDTLNGSVAKHEARLNEQAIMNAQTTITQQQIVKELKVLQDSKKNARQFWLNLLAPVLTSAVGFLILLILIRTGILNLSKEPQYSSAEIEDVIIQVLQDKVVNAEYEQ